MHAGRLPGAEFNVGDAHSFAHVGTEARAVAQQDVVELGAAHLVGDREILVQRIAEVVHRRFVALVIEFGPGLEHADGLHFRTDAETVNDRHVQGQERFTDVKARVVLLLQQRHLPALLGEEGRHGRAGGPAADHQDIAGGRHGVRGLVLVDCCCLRDHLSGIPRYGVVDGPECGANRAGCARNHTDFWRPVNCQAPVTRFPSGAIRDRQANGAGMAGRWHGRQGWCCGKMGGVSRLRRQTA
jgi:hypothetical protein